MKLILQNGYPSPWPEGIEDEEGEGYAYAAPVVDLKLEGVVHFEWKHYLTVEFRDLEAYEKAKTITGWKKWGYGLVLEAETHAGEGYGHPAIVANVPYEEHPKTAYCGFMLVALKPNEEARRLTPLQAMVATHYQGGEFGHIETQDDAQNVGDGLFTFCVNEAGDAGDKAEFINMLNRAIEQLRSLVGELEAVDGRIGEGVAA